MADPRRPDRINTTRVTAADLLPLLFPPRSAENQEGSNPTEVPPYTLLPTVGEATIGFNRDTMEDPPSYPLSTLLDPTQVYEESRRGGCRTPSNVRSTSSSSDTFASVDLSFSHRSPCLTLSNDFPVQSLSASLSRFTSSEDTR